MGVTITNGAHIAAAELCGFAGRVSGGAGQYILGYGTLSGWQSPSVYRHRYTVTVSAPVKKITISLYFSACYNTGALAGKKFYASIGGETEPGATEDTQEFTSSGGYRASFSVTRDADNYFMPGSTYYLWISCVASGKIPLLGSNGSSTGYGVLEAEIDGELGGGLAHVDNGSTMDNYLVFIDNGTGFDQYLPYIDTGAAWTPCA
jgi:hypothetical protein